MADGVTMVVEDRLIGADCPFVTRRSGRTELRLIRQHGIHDRGAFDGRVMQTCTPPDSTVYYNSTYWNDLPPVIEHISEICTGDRSKWWVPGFKERYCERGPFEHGLFLACGNGWVEREFVDWDIVRRATAFDYSTELLGFAERERGSREIDYFQADANTIDFEPDSFDLIVNVGALHHVQYLDRLCRILCKALKPGGV